MVYRIALCYENNTVMKYLHHSIIRFKEYKSAALEVRLYNSVKNFLYDIEENQGFDMVFLDTCTKGMSGCELGKIIREKSPGTLIVFTSERIEHAVDLFEVPAFRFIPENLLKNRIYNVLNDGFTALSEMSSQYIILSVGSGYIKIPCAQIKYICKDNHYSVLYIEKSVEKMRKSLQSIYDMLNKQLFFYSERGFIVNISYIKRLEQQSVILKDGVTLPVSRGKFLTLKEAFLNSPFA